MVVSLHAADKAAPHPESSQRTTALPASTVGLPVEVEQLVLPGTELEPAPWDDKSPIVIRVEAVYPHGTSLRYDLMYQGLEPGEHDLRKYLAAKMARPLTICRRFW